MRTGWLLVFWVAVALVVFFAVGFGWAVWALNRDRKADKE